MNITTNVVSSNPAQGDVYSIQHYVINIVESDIKHHKPNPLKKQLWIITNVISTRKEAMMFEIRNILFPFSILDNTKIDKTYMFVSDTIQCYLYNYWIHI